MKLTPFIRAALYAEVGAYADRDAYVSDLVLSSIWGDAEDAEVPAERLALLGAIWDGTRCTIPELIKQHGLTQTASRSISISRFAPCRAGALVNAPARRM